MTRERTPRFETQALLERAGLRAFERGEDYHADGLVRIVALEPARVLAIVSGNEDYRTTLTGGGASPGGDCTCPAFRDWGFCKHMVAVGLAANAASGDVQAAWVDQFARIGAYLKTRDVDTLARMILDLAGHDTALLNKLELASAAAEPDGGKLEARLSAAIEDALDLSDYLDHRAAPEWANGVADVLSVLEDLADGEHAALVIDLAERVIEGVEEAIESIDDSDGNCGGLLHRAAQIHLAAARVAKPDPLTLARDLFFRAMADDYGTFGGAAIDYADVLGAAGLAEYRRLALEAWNKLPPRQGRRTSGETLADYHTLMAILDDLAERDGDVAARVALRAKNLATTGDYLALAQFCLSAGDEAEALRRAEEGLFVFEDDRPDERLVAFAAERLANAGRKTEAAARLWRAFDKTPSLDLYHRMRDLADETMRERAIERLRSRAAKEAATRWHHPADLLVRVLIHERRFDKAWAAVKAHGASVGVREALAKETETTHPREAVAVYAESVEALAGGAGGRPAYAEAAALVDRMARLRDAAEHARYLLEVKSRFGRRRNFIALLA